MKKYVFGDIHGCFNELTSLIDEIRPNLGVDKLIFLGDYIDRGPNSYKVIRFLMDLQSKYGKDDIVLLRGNHEDMAIDYINSGYSGNLNGYRDTYVDFLRNGDDVSNYLSFFQSLPLYYEDDNFIYVHGGILPGTPMHMQSSQDLLWIRNRFYESSALFHKTVFFGHTPTKNMLGVWAPFIQEDRIGIDTGCVYGGFLTAIEIIDDSRLIVHTSKKIAA